MVIVVVPVNAVVYFHGAAIHVETICAASGNRKGASGNKGGRQHGCGRDDQLFHCLSSTVNPKDSQP
jgi:hypothetical protein